MSVLERFVRIRRLRTLAADHYGLAAESFSDSVRARYLAIADHYTALAEAELLSDKRERTFRLAGLQAKRAAARAQRLHEPPPAPPAVPQPRTLRLIKGDGVADKRRVILPARRQPTLAGFATKRER